LQELLNRENISVEEIREEKNKLAEKLTNLENTFQQMSTQNSNLEKTIKELEQTIRELIKMLEAEGVKLFDINLKLYQEAKEQQNIQSNQQELESD